ncbi:response regulator [Candidatus Woesearchaeota archaeon]|jgi:DNA-binding response OmpR family regulator|nr:response regulator [Candidatus Woesearchaeota archaeon]
MAEKKKVMIVDDEFTIRELVALTLEPDFEIIKAESGEEALEKIKHNNPDLIILDIMMPNMNGYQVCKILRADKNTSNTPIIMLTAKHQVEDVKRAIETGADEYITKPFEPDLLRKRINEYFGDKKIERKLFQYGKSIHYIKGREDNIS